MTIFGIRHLPTVYSNNGLLLGTINEPIASPSAHSLHLLDLHRARLADQNIDAVITSSLLRTQQTAKVCGYGCYTVDRLADELNFGFYEGRAKTQLIEDCGTAWHLNPGRLLLGESIEQLSERIKLFVDKYRKMNDVLLFGHGAWLRAAYALIVCRDINKMNQMEIAPGGMVIIEC